MESKRLFSKKIITIFVLFFLVFLYLFLPKIKKTISLKGEIEEFIKTEKRTFKSYRSWVIYGDYGLNILYVPHPFNFLFNQNEKLQKAKITTLPSFQVSPLITKEQFVVQQNRFFPDLMRVTFLFFSILFFSMGFFSFKSRDHLQLYGDKKNIYLMLLTRLSLLLIIVGSFIFIIFFIISIIIKVELSLSTFVQYLTYSIIILTIFFLLGVLFSALRCLLPFIKNIAFPVWIILILLVPEIWTNQTANGVESKTNIDNSYIEIDKQLTKFESEATEKLKNIDQSNKEEILKFKQNQALLYCQRDKLETQKEIRYYSDLQARLSDSENLSVFFPITYYEDFFIPQLFGSGYSNRIDFLKHIAKKRNEFLNYIIDNRWFKRTKEVKPFLTDKEMIYYAGFNTPSTYKKALLTALSYLLILLLMTYFPINTYFNIKIKQKKGVLDKIQKGEVKEIKADNPLHIKKQFDPIKSIFVYNAKKEYYDQKMTFERFIKYLRPNMKNFRDNLKTGFHINFSDIIDIKLKDVLEDDLKAVYISAKLSDLKNKSQIYIDSIAIGTGTEFKRNLVKFLYRKKFETFKIIYVSKEPISPTPMTDSNIHTLT